MLRNLPGPLSLSFDHVNLISQNFNARLNLILTRAPNHLDLHGGQKNESFSSAFLCCAALSGT